MTEEKNLMEELKEEGVVEETTTEEVKEKSKPVEAEPKSVEEEVDSEVNLDELKSKAPKDMRRVLTKEELEKLPEVLTIEEIKLGKPKTKDASGNDIDPEGKDGNLYYKGKLIVHIKEEFNGEKVRFFIPSLFFSVNDGEVSRIPGFPKVVADEDMDDRMKSSLGKVRNLYCKAKGVNPNEVSDSEFAKGLVGMKFKPGMESGTYNGKWYKLIIVDFVN